MTKLNASLLILGIGRAHFVHALVSCWPELKSTDTSSSLFWRILLTGMIEITDWELLKVYFYHAFVILTAEQVSDTTDNLAYVQARIDQTVIYLESSTTITSIISVWKIHLR